MFCNVALGKCYANANMSMNSPCISRTFHENYSEENIMNVQVFRPEYLRVKSRNSLNKKFETFTLNKCAKIFFGDQL